MFVLCQITQWKGLQGVLAIKGTEIGVTIEGLRPFSNDPLLLDSIRECEFKGRRVLVDTKTLKVVLLPYELRWAIGNIRRNSDPPTIVLEAYFASNFHSETYYADAEEARLCGCPQSIIREYQRLQQLTLGLD